MDTCTTAICESNILVNLLLFVLIICFVCFVCFFVCLFVSIVVDNINRMYV